VDLTHLEKYPNVKFCGLVPQKELPEKIREFDVCLNVFREGRLSKDVSPLKFYEYLATGKPVVSTREPLQVSDFADVVHVASGLDDFLTKCDEALHEEEPIKGEKAAKRMEYGRQCSWDERVKQMETILVNKGIFK
jgi:glycosyltransferase involved in cell wall biosynthesis